MAFHLSQKLTTLYRAKLPIAARSQSETVAERIAQAGAPLCVALTVDTLSKSYGDRAVLSQVSLKIKAGEFVGIVGKSGCGKSTLLRLIAGLETPDAGQIRIAGKPLNGLNAQSRFMFQEARLLPWKRVGENVALGLTGPDRRERARAALSQVGLADRENEWPGVLSGGQKQRIALARALANRLPLLLLDEPLGALDALTRFEMQGLIERIQATLGFTALLVTHDIEEAIALCDRVVLLENGKISAEVPVTLPRPRPRNTAAFVAMKDELLMRLLSLPATYEI